VPDSQIVSQASGGLLGGPAELFVYLAAILSAFLISFLLTFLLIRWAPRLNLVDHPGERKVHFRTTPKGGGLAVFVAMLVSSALASYAFSLGITLTLGLSIVIVTLGLVDDLRPLPWQLRLGIQTGIAATAVSFWRVDAEWSARFAAVLWIVALVNAFNMLDNMDALSGGVAWIAAAGFAALLWLHSGAAWDGRSALPYLLLMGALSGFLWFNRPPARIFMGDAGSTFLGFFLGVLSLQGGIAPGSAPQAWLVPCCILAVPWYDLVCVVALRLWQGHSPFHGDKQHLSHRLVHLGLGSTTAVRVIYLFGLASAMSGLLLDHVSGVETWLVVGQLVCWWLAVATVEYFAHFRSAGAKTKE